ncbi:hypothetical protein [Benzoatithermus flavus]|uniref:Uncharacterized protein n=1 Tax=Benzoatithermus flavus TaxID=3108223 RepID=A0ABU8XRX1_9PROT
MRRPIVTMLLAVSPLVPGWAQAVPGPALAADAPRTAPAPPTRPGPDLYRLAGGRLHVTYATTGIAGRPSLTYRDGTRTLRFTGNQIRVQDTELGQLVTVTLRLTVDTGSTTFTLLLPHVNLETSTSARIDTIGITTMHRFSVIPSFRQGQADLYGITRLQGTAQLVLFRHG